MNFRTVLQGPGDEALYTPERGNCHWNEELYYSQIVKGYKTKPSILSRSVLSSSKRKKKTEPNSHKRKRKRKNPETLDPNMSGRMLKFFNPKLAGTGQGLFPGVKKVQAQFNKTHEDDSTGAHNEGLHSDSGLTDSGRIATTNWTGLGRAPLRTSSFPKRLDQLAQTEDVVDFQSRLPDGTLEAANLRPPPPPPLLARPRVEPALKAASRVKDQPPQSPGTSFADFQPEFLWGYHEPEPLTDLFGTPEASKGRADLDQLPIPDEVTPADDFTQWDTNSSQFQKAVQNWTSSQFQTKLRLPTISHSGTRTAQTRLLDSTPPTAGEPLDMRCSLLDRNSEPPRFSHNSISKRCWGGAGSGPCSKQRTCLMANSMHSRLSLWTARRQTMNSLCKRSRSWPSSNHTRMSCAITPFGGSISTRLSGRC